MDKLDDWLIAIHILSAVIWVGGSFVTQAHAIRAQHGGAVSVGSFGQDSEFIGFRVFLPAALTVLITGIWLISRDVFTLDQWNVWGLIVAGSSLATGAGYLGPESGKIAGLIDDRGPDDPEAMRRLSRLFVVSRVELTLLVSVVLVMAIKPFAG